MTVHVLHAGDGYTYLTHQVASGDHQRRRGEALADYYTAAGNPPGRWVGTGLAAMGVDGRVSEAQMKARTAAALPVSRVKATRNRPSGTSIFVFRALPSDATDSSRSRRRDSRLAAFRQASRPLASSIQLVISSITTVSGSTVLTP